LARLKKKISNSPLSSHRQKELCAATSGIACSLNRQIQVLEAFNRAHSPQFAIACCECCSAELSNELAVKRPKPRSVVGNFSRPIPSKLDDEGEIRIAGGGGLSGKTFERHCAFVREPYRVRVRLDRETEGNGSLRKLMKSWAIRNG